MKQVLVPIALVRVFQQCSRESEHVPEHPPCEAITNVRFVPKADIEFARINSKTSAGIRFPRHLGHTASVLIPRARLPIIATGARHAYFRP